MVKNGSDSNRHWRFVMVTVGEGLIIEGGVLDEIQSSRFVSRDPSRHPESFFDVQKFLDERK